MRKYIAGNLIESDAQFTKDDNVTPIDPTTVQVLYTITQYGNTSGPYTITYAGATVPANGVIARTAQGAYTVQIDTSLLPGYWLYEWKGAGAAQIFLPLSAIVYPTPL